MRQFSCTVGEVAASLWRNRGLIAVLTRRDVIGRYAGSVLGVLWSLFNPVVMLAVYTFVFSIVFKARWNAGSESRTEFALVLFAGLIVFTLFAECVNRAPGLILSNANYVKKVVFPLEILPWVSMGSALFHLLVSLAVWLVFCAIFHGTPHLTALLFPLITLPLLLLTMGICWVLASLGVYLRDVSQVIGVITSTLLFLSPVFYPTASLPIDYQRLLRFNPLAQSIEQARDVLFWGTMPDWSAYAVYLVASAAFAWAGFAWFQKTRKGFSDVL